MVKYLRRDTGCSRFTEESVFVGGVCPEYWNQFNWDYKLVKIFVTKETLVYKLLILTSNNFNWLTSKFNKYYSCFLDVLKSVFTKVSSYWNRTWPGSISISKIDTLSFKNVTRPKSSVNFIVGTNFNLFKRNCVLNYFVFLQTFFTII